MCHIIVDIIPPFPYLLPMNSSLHFDLANHQIAGPAGALDIDRADHLARRFLMLLEGQCLQSSVRSVAHKYGLSRPRYYQLLDRFQHGGLLALQPQKKGPKSNYRRTDQAVRQVLRYLFLDPDASADVVAQKLRQTHFAISLRSVQRIIADYGLQKKTLRVEPLPPVAPTAGRHPGQPPHPKRGHRRRAQPRTGGAPTAGR